MKKLLFVGMGVMGAFITGHAQNVDLLKPEMQVKELAVKRFIESFKDLDMTYSIRTQKYLASTSVSGWTEKEVDEYIVTLPEDIQTRFNALDKQVRHDMLVDYLDDERYSFSVAVLMMAESIVFRRTFYDFFAPVAIEKKDRTLWNQTSLRNRVEFVDSYNRAYKALSIPQSSATQDLYIKAVEYRRGIKDESYRYAVLRESISVTYTNQIFTVTNCPAFMAYIRNKFQSPASYNQRKSLEHFFNFSFPTFCYISNLSRLPIAPFASSEWKIMRMSDTQKFLCICRENEPVTKPYLSALMMALLTVDGYSFNDETGVYTMNERGTMLMDYIVEFPIPENATRLRAVMNGGNKDEIEAMMKKHGTEEKWQELLKNPVHPEFAKYPQDAK